ncbi:hypothetical protein GCM10010508_29060 [Streptomyces naganishii JCM 4654]|uniref:Uncharacterized protein n=1 Tax=Streptomyces naganishii JCM 4654 TaxID=1306179 RepID=A0A918Y403_9ACTN|nr:hypothetical protein GCM10010508_29060 [Streptomyces naganishii JCM 4654]
MHPVPVSPGTSDSVTSTSSSPVGEISTLPVRVIAETRGAAFGYEGDGLRLSLTTRTYLARTDDVTLYCGVPPFR